MPNARSCFLCIALAGCSPVDGLGSGQVPDGLGTGPDQPEELISLTPLQSPAEHSSSSLLIYLESQQSGITHEHSLRYSDDDRWLDDFGGGMAALDCDIDGDVDLFFTVSDGPDLLYRNDGRGYFSVDTGLPLTDNTGVSTAASQADFDNDGDPDLLVLRQHASNQLLVNDGFCNFEDRTEFAGLEDGNRSLHASWVDIDNDGWLDIYVTNWAGAELGGEVGIPPQAQPDALWRNRQDGTFEDVSDQLPALTRDALGMATAFLDFDGDGLLDLFQSNDRGVIYVPHRAFRNLGLDGDGRLQFEDVSSELSFGFPMNGMGLSLADIDGDLDPDFLLTGNFETILRWQEPGFFVESGTALGLEVYDPDVVSWAGSYFDADADGDQDLYFVQSSVFPHGFFDVQTYGRAPRFFLNEISENGQLHSVDMSSTSADVQVTRSLLVDDLDGDGYRDLVHGNVQSSPQLVLSNAVASGNILQLRLQGTRSNRDGRGARVELGIGDRSQVRWPGASEPFGSGGTSSMSFGLGDAAQADWLRVHWPSGVVSTLGPQPAGHLLVVTEPE
jgi:enediyne biosynthesis protein E4